MNDMDDQQESGGNAAWQSLGNWTLWHQDLGKLTAYSYYFYPKMWAGGFILAGLGYPKDQGTSYHSWDSWNLFADLERRILTLRLSQELHGKHWYLNSLGDGDYIMLWHDRDHYESTSITPDQEFDVVNLGKNQIALKARGGPHRGRYMTAVKGGWYVVNSWYMGAGYVTFSKGATTVGPAEAFTVAGSMLPVLRLTNSARENNLSHENLYGLDLSGADFSHATLTGTRFAGALSIKGAQFEGAAFEQTVLDGLALSDAKGFEHATFANCDLRKIRPSANSVLNHATFSAHSNLSAVHLAGSKLAGAHFHKVDLDGTDLTGADLTGAVFDTVSLKGTILRNTKLQSAQFVNCDLSTAVFDEKPAFNRSTTARNCFHHCTLPFAVISNDWSYLDLTDTVITNIAESIEHLNASHALLPDRLPLAGKTLRQANFEGSRMYWIQLTAADLKEAVFKGALLKGAKLDKANLSVADLTDAYLLDETVSASELPSALRDNKASAATAANAFFIDAKLDGAHCDGVDFSSAMMMTYAGFSGQPTSALGATLNLANFDQATLVQVNFDGAHCAGASFNGAVLVGATLRKVSLSPQQEAPHRPASVHGADIRGTNFSEANMDGLDMLDATVAREPGKFEKSYKDFYGKLTIFLTVDYGKTIYGSTTSGTTCPDGAAGPCKL
jgi:uncharacterized protein YjbI with pentapeptide repeats